MSLSLTSLTLTATSSPLQWHSGHLNWSRSSCIHSLMSPSPAVTRELVSCIFKLKPFYMLSRTPFVTFLNISEVNKSNSSPFSSYPLTTGCFSLFLSSYTSLFSFCFRPFFLNFLPIFIVWGFQGQYLGLLVPLLSH